MSYFSLSADCPFCRRLPKPETPLYRKDTIHEQYNELYLQYKAGYSVVFCVYNSGVAYRFETAFKEPITDWNARTIEIALKDMGITSGAVTMFVDVHNAHRKGVDYQKKTISVPDEGKLSVELAPRRGSGGDSGEIIV